MGRSPFLLGSPLVALLLMGVLPSLLTHAEPAGDLTEIRALRRRGGLEATRGLEPWIRRGSEEERIAVLDAVAAVGARTRKITLAVREAADSGASVAEQTAALAALGRSAAPTTSDRRSTC